MECIIMLTRRNNSNQRAVAGAAAGLMRLIADNAPQLAQMSGKAARQLWNSRSSFAPQPSYSGGAIQKITIQRGGTKKKKKKGKGKGKPQSRNLSEGIPSILTDSRIRVTLRDVYNVTNNAANSYSNSLQLAVNYTSGKDFNTWLPRAVTLSGSFRFFKVKSLILTFQPYLPSTSYGAITMGVDPDPSAGAPSGLSVVVRHCPSTVGDVKDRHSLSWIPGDDYEDLDHYCNAAASIPNPLQNIATVQIYSTNSEANGAILGYIFYEVDIEFYGLY
jgi:hypothetical protein